MKIISGRFGRQVVAVAAVGGLVAALAALPRGSNANPAAAEFRFPTVAAGHKHARELLANAMRYADPKNKLTDPASGYPYEGWNQEPERKVFLRSFTQLTAIGVWMELLANVAAGQADTPYLSRDLALTELVKVVKSLRQDQKDPQLSAKGLLGNFLDLSAGRRRGPLTMDADKSKFLAEFGPEKGEKIWKALVEKGWLQPQPKSDTATVKRDGKYGEDCFDGALEPYCDADTKRKVMELLDRRTVLVIFGDNANLSAAAAKTIGALLLPGVKDKPEAVTIRQELEQFLDGQKDGYARLYDPKAGQFYFGWDCQKDRLFGWENQDGKWVPGHTDYLVNEFRGPAALVCIRNGFGLRPIKNLGFKMKPYHRRDGRDVYTLAPWEGSAFQLFGLEISMGEVGNPSWRKLLQTAVDIEIDYATRHKLPGFLSESYTGEGIQYTGSVGIPSIAVSPGPRLTDIASLYTLGPAYTIAPDDVERFFGANWSAISNLFTDHGPWEGYNMGRKEPIRFQTTAHTVSLALGILGNSSDNMRRYLDAHGLGEKLTELYRPGPAADLLAENVNVFAWAQKEHPVKSARDNGGFRVTGDGVGEVGIAFVPAAKNGVNISGEVLTLRYRSAGPTTPAVIALKPAGPPPAALIPTELFTRFVTTGKKEEEIRILLPATPGLTEIAEIVITYGPKAKEQRIDLTVTAAAVEPIPAADHR